MKKILIASPIKQKANILNEFLKSLKELDKTNLDIYYYLYPYIVLKRKVIKEFL